MELEAGRLTIISPLYLTPETVVTVQGTNNLASGWTDLATSLADPANPAAGGYTPRPLAPDVLIADGGPPSDTLMSVSAPADSVRFLRLRFSSR